MSWYTKTIAAFVLVITGCGRLLFAQSSTDRIVGTLTDASGAIIPGVEVVIPNPATGLTRTGITNESGTYNVALLPPSVYQVEASLPGFRQEIRSGITLQVDAVLRVDFALRVGDIADKIEVMADAPLVQNETATLGQVMDSRKVTDLPLNLRHVMSLTTLATGVMPVVQRSNLSNQNLAFHANGGREHGNNFLMDGVDNNDTGNGSLVILPSVDAVQEFKISSSLYGAELGRASGGVLNVQIKSGTNDFHLTVFEFIRNDVFDARNFFAAKKQPFRRNQFGAVISGPILKDRWFFMFNYEGNKVRRPESQLSRVPRLRERVGDFSELNRQLIDPITRDPFPGNIIPASRIEQIGHNIATFWPDPNRPLSGGANYLSDIKGTTDFDLITTNSTTAYRKNKMFLCDQLAGCFRIFPRRST